MNSTATPIKLFPLRTATCCSNNTNIAMLTRTHLIVVIYKTVVQH